MNAGDANSVDPGNLPPPDEWLVSLDESTLAVVKSEKLCPPAGGSIDLIITIDPGSGYPLQVDVRERDGSRRDLNPEESRRLTEAYSLAAAFWRSYAAYADTEAARPTGIGVLQTEADSRPGAMPARAAGEV
jgi:hypothetical protein